MAEPDRTPDPSGAQLLVGSTRPADPAPGTPDPGAGLCGDCLVALAHRLAQPLTALRGSLELGLRFARTPEDCRAALEQAIEQTDVLVHLLEALRDLGASCAPEGPLELVRLEELIAEVGEEWRALQPDPAVEIVLDSRHPAPIRALPQRLREGLLRLLQALAREPGQLGGAIRLASSADGGQGCLTIADERPSASPQPPAGAARCRTPGEEFAAAAKAGRLEWAIARRLLECAGGVVEEEFSASGQPTWYVRWPLAPEPAA